MNVFSRNFKQIQYILENSNGMTKAKTSRTGVLFKNSKTIGYLKEQIVAQYLRNKGWTVLYQNEKILGVEIDILAKKDEEYRLIEVKSLKKKEHLERILKVKQKERLQKAVQSLCDSIKEIRFFLAAVDDKNKIEFFEVY